MWALRRLTSSVLKFLLGEGYGFKVGDLVLYSLGKPSQDRVGTITWKSTLYAEVTPANGPSGRKDLVYYEDMTKL